MAVGITSYGSYASYRRLKRAAIAQVLGIPTGGSPTGSLMGGGTIAGFTVPMSPWAARSQWVLAMPNFSASYVGSTARRRGKWWRFCAPNVACGLLVQVHVA